MRRVERSASVKKKTETRAFDAVGKREGTGRDAGRGERCAAANGARASGHRASDARVKHARSRHYNGVVSYLAVQHRVRAVEQVRHDAHSATNDRRRARLARSVRARTPPRRPGASRSRTRNTRRVIRTLSRNDTDQRSALGCDALPARAHRHRRGKGEGQTAAQGKSPYERLFAGSPCDAREDFQSTQAARQFGRLALESGESESSSNSAFRSDFPSAVCVGTRASRLGQGAARGSLSAQETGRHADPPRGHAREVRVAHHGASPFSPRAQSDAPGVLSANDFASRPRAFRGARAARPPLTCGL